MARPKGKAWDEEQFKRLCLAQCTEDEIAGVMGFTVDQLKKRCKKHHKRTFEQMRHYHESQGKFMLRENQKASADSGNTAMMIWLGKQYLGQADKQETITITPEEEMKRIREAEAQVESMLKDQRRNRKKDDDGKSQFELSA